MAIRNRLRAVWAALSGAPNAFAYPWHLPAADRAPVAVNERTALTLTAVFKACSLLSDAATSAPALLYARPQSGGRVVDSSSAAARALATITHSDMELFAFSTALTGNGFLRIYRDGTGAPFELRAVPPYLVSMEVEEGPRAIWYRLMADPLTGEPEVVLPEADVVHAKYRASSNRLMGVPPMVSCAPAFAMALQSRAVQKYLFQNLATPGVVLVAPGKMEPAVAKKLQAEFEANYSAGGAGRTAVLSNGLDIKSVVWRAADQQLLEQIQASVQDIARAYTIPQYFLEHQSTTTYASASEATRALYSSAQKPFTLRLADALALKLLTRNDRAAGAGISFDLSDSLVMPGKELSDFVGGLVSQGLITPNEARNTWLKLPDQPGGDTLRIPSATVPADALAQGGKVWEPDVKYERGQWAWHDGGLWRFEARTGEHDEPTPWSPNWDCLVPGLKSVDFIDGKLTFEMSNGHTKTVEAHQ